ncbi:MAG: hypothetical protein LBR22_08525 [Desulfovibrio sp.]|jgi:hypothetical protein|nr:hypothetical protein [Desulfovibrio sp.]
MCKALVSLVIILAFGLFVSSVTMAGDVTMKLYKEYRYGQPKENFAGKPGYSDCTELLSNDSICREDQKFAGFNDWAEALIFDNNKLIQVALIGEMSQDRYIKSLGVLTNGGFLPVAMKSGDKALDALNIFRTKGLDVYRQELDAFEMSAHNSEKPFEITFAPADAVKNTKANTCTELLTQSNLDLRCVDIVISDEVLLFRFYAPAMMMRDAQKIIKDQKESF